MDRYFIKNTNFGQFECPPRIKTVEEYNKLATDIRKNTAGCIEPVIKLAKEYLSKEGFSSGGSLHIVLSDGNIERMRYSMRESEKKINGLINELGGEVIS